MDIDDEPLTGFHVLLILLLQSLCFHIEMPPSFLGFMLSVVVVTDIEDIVVMLIYLRHKITCNSLPTKLGHWVHSSSHAHESPNLLHMKFCFSELKLM